MTLAEFVAAVKELFDAPDARVTAWVNNRYQQMVTQAEWRMVEMVLAATVTGQQAYDVPADAVDLRAVKVGDVEYSRVTSQQMWSLTDPTNGAMLDGPGVFAPSFDAAAQAQISLYPVPASDGVDITGLMAFVPPPLAAGDSPLIPTDFHAPLLDGVLADAYGQLTARYDLAQPHEQKFADGVERLRRRKNSRVGSGAVAPQVQGYHF